MLIPVPIPVYRFTLCRTVTTAVTNLHQTLCTPVSLMADKCESMVHLKQIHARMIITSRIRDAYAASRLINFCALSDSGDLNYALKLFNHTPVPNLFMWNTLIRALSASLNPSRALIMYSQMRRLGIVPGRHTFPFVLKACSAFRSGKCCEQVHGHVLKFGLDFDLYVLNGLVRGYSVLGSGGLCDARKVFDELCERNLSIWTTMICGYAQNDSPEEAIKLFYRMIADGFEPSEVVLSSVLSACSKSVCLELGEQIHRYMEEKGMDLGVILGTAVVDMYARNGELVKAKHCFDGLKAKNVATWNALICGLAVHGHAAEAIHFFKMLEREELKPNEITLVGVLSACCHAGLLIYGSEIFNSMKRAYDIEPKVEHYSCMVDLLARGGRILEAEELIRGMPWKADVVIWAALLRGCRECGNIEVAERVVKEILYLEPQNHGAYVVLSNMYAEAGRWEEVMKRRQGMKERCLKKTAGWSLVG